MPVLLRAQAVAEYGRGASQSVIPGASSEPPHLGVCRLNALFFSCAWQSYPRLMLAVVLVSVMLLAKVAFRPQRV